MNSEPRFQHSASDLRYVADLLDLLNTTTDGNVTAIDGSLDVYWCELVMGRIGFENDVWVYYPVATGEKPEQERGDEQ